MNDPNAVSPRSVDNSDAPGGDLLFDDLFPADGMSTDSSLTTANDGVPQTPVTPEPQIPAPPSWEEIKTSTGSVYKTRDEVIKGIEHKDALLNSLRSREIERTGIDPVTNQPVVRQTPQAPGVDYSATPEKYLEDLRKAAENADARSYADIQAKFVNDLLAPIAPLIQDVARTKAVNTVSGEIKDFQTFLQSPDYTATLDSNPILKDAISRCEGDFRGHSQLPGLYKLAHQAHVATKLPDLLKAAQAQAAPAPTPQSVRPTTSASTLSPPTPTAAPDLRTSEGRKALIADLESKGILNRRW